MFIIDDDFQNGQLIDSDKFDVPLKYTLNLPGPNAKKIIDTIQPTHPNTLQYIIIDEITTNAK